jgi:hypothetical protein
LKSIEHQTQDKPSLLEEEKECSNPSSLIKLIKSKMESLNGDHLLEVVNGLKLSGIQVDLCPNIIFAQLAFY